MAIANHFVSFEQRIQVRRQRAERDQLCAWNLRKVVLPLLAHIDQQQFVAAADAFVYFLRRDLHIIHLGSWPRRSTLPQKRGGEALLAQEFRRPLFEKRADSLAAIFRM